MHVASAVLYETCVKSFTTAASMIDNRPGLMLPPGCLLPLGVPGRAAGKGLELKPPFAVPGSGAGGTKRGRSALNPLHPPP